MYICNKCGHRFPEPDSGSIICPNLDCVGEEDCRKLKDEELPVAEKMTVEERVANIEDYLGIE